MTQATQLTPRQREVLVKIAEGKLFKQIADELGIAYNTVEQHCMVAYRTIGVHDRVLATHFVLAQGWIKNHFA